MLHTLLNITFLYERYNAWPVGVNCFKGSMVIKTKKGNHLISSSLCLISHENSIVLIVLISLKKYIYKAIITIVLKGI